MAGPMRAIADLVADAVTNHWEASRLKRVIDRLPPLPILLPALNLAGSAALGLMVLGAWGLLVGPLLMVAALATAVVWRWVAALRWAPWLGGRSRPSPEPRAAPAADGRPLWIEAALTSAIRRLVGVIAGFFSERALPFTMLNIALLAVLGTLLIGIDFAFWLALGAVPIILVGLMLMSLEGQDVPEDSLEDDDA